MTSTLELPVIDLAVWLSRTSDSQPEVLKLAADVANSLEKSGILIIKDPRVDEDENNRFINLMERYFSLPLEEKMKDVRAELHYQVGATPEGVEIPQCGYDEECRQLIASQEPENKAHQPEGPDPKWRYFWRIGERPKETKFEDLNAKQVIPHLLADEWPDTMNRWGTLMMACIQEISQLAAVGLELPVDTFHNMIQNGPHLLAPTGSNLNEHNELDTIFAGFHTDLNFITIHGKSRFPGLSVWLRDGRKASVKIPDGCLLAQAGQQLEYLTGGRVMAGYHEVVVNENTLQAIELAKQQHRSLWRVSSTLFSHIASDQLLKPLHQYETAESLRKYPAMLTGDYVKGQLAKIKLASESSVKKEQ